MFTINFHACHSHSGLQVCWVMTVSGPQITPINNRCMKNIYCQVCRLTASNQSQLGHFLDAETTRNHRDTKYWKLVKAPQVSKATELLFAHFFKDVQKISYIERKCFIIHQKNDCFLKEIYNNQNNISDFFNTLWPCVLLFRWLSHFPASF